MPWGELAHERPPLDARARCARPARATTSSTGSSAARGCTRSARRRAAPTSASAGAAARRRSRSWATRARAPAATAPSTPPSAAIRSTRSSPGASRPPRSAWDCATSSSRRSIATISTTAAPSIGRAPSARCAGAFRRPSIEVLTPDFLGREEDVARDGARGAPARLQPQHRDSAPDPAARAHQGRLRPGALAARGGPARSGTSAGPSAGR